MVRVHQDPPQKKRGLSSAGRAPALQAGGQRFDPVSLHQALARLQKFFEIKNFCERAAFFAVCFLFFKNLEKK